MEMTKEQEALKRIETTFSMNKQGKESVYREYTNSVYPYYEDFDLVLNALKRLESIDNANPSEALECLKHIKKYYITEPCSAKTYDCLETIKQALLKAQEHNSTNIFKGSKEVKIEIPESSLMDYNPVKQYLKWEDLEFKEKELVGQMKVKLGDNIYYIEWFKRNDYKTVNFYTNVDDNILSYTSYVSEEHKQFFNDLHLERVEE